MAQQFISNPTVNEMPRTADVIVIGGGPAGTACLWAIERAAPGTKTILIEKGAQLGSGSSLASLENYRSSWPPTCLAQQMKHSIEVYQNADDYLGEGAQQALVLRKQGYLYCAFTEKQVRQLKADVEHLHRLGNEAIEFWTADDVEQHYPWLNSVIAGKYDPNAGWLDSNALVHHYARSARSAKILTDVEDTRLRIENNQVVGVSTANGDIDSPNVVIAAGAGSRQVAGTGGIDLPIVLRPRQSFTTSWRHEDYTEDAPMLIGVSTHVRPEAQSGAIFGWEYHWNNKLVKAEDEITRDHLLDPLHSVEQAKDPRFPSIVLACMAQQFGHEDGYGFADTRYLRGIAHNIGYYIYRAPSNTFVEVGGEKQSYVSQRAIIGQYPGIDGLFLSVAHVGHGIMASAASGEIIASYVLNQPLADPSFADFGLDVHWVEHDSGEL